jgi:ribosome recycling factor
MDENIQLVTEEAQTSMEGAIDFLKNQLVKIRTGKASPEMLDDVVIEYYGTSTPLKQVGTVSAADARMLTVTPWEKSMIPTIDKAIREAGLGFNPSSDSDMVRVPIPALNEERRKQLVKQAKDEAEQARISLRSMRKQANDELKQLQKDGLPEDDVKEGEKQVQELTKKYTEMVDQIIKDKESQIMTV